MNAATSSPDPPERVPDYVPDWLSNEKAHNDESPEQPNVTPTADDPAQEPTQQRTEPTSDASQATGPRQELAALVTVPMLLSDRPPERRPWKPMPTWLRRMYGVFYTGMMSLALYGQVPGLSSLLHNSGSLPNDADWVATVGYYAPAVVFGAVLEFVGAMLLRTADWRRIERRESMTVPYLGAAGIAVLVAGLNLYSHWGQVVSPLFTAASLVAFGMWMYRSHLQVRDALHERGELVDIPHGTPEVVATRARQLAIRHPGYDSWVYVKQAGQEIEREERHAAVRQAIRDELAATGHDATLALGVLDLDRIAAEVSRSVDYPAITSRLADRLTADRVTTGKRPAGTDRPTDRSTGNSDRPTAKRPPERSTGNRDRKRPVDRPAGRSDPAARSDRSTGTAADRLAREYDRLRRDLGREPSGSELAEAAECSKTVANDWKRSAQQGEAHA